MAGAGYKLFATGDVLTAAQVNTYLMQQTVMVFASSAARTTALSGVLAEGMVSYLQDSNTLEVYDGSAWVGATGDITGLTAGTGISISSATGPVPTVTNSMATEITAKGDLIVGTGSGTFDNLAAGSNGETLVADSSTSTGLRWQGDFAAGKNKIINGDFGVWQRGTSGFSFGAAYNADRWAFYRDGSGATEAITQQTFTPGAAPVSGYESQFFWRYASTVAGSGGTEKVLYQRIEDVRKFANQTVTVSFWAKADASRTITVALTQNFGSGGSTSVTTSLTSQSVTTSWARYSASVSIPSISGKTIGTSSYLQLNLGFPVNVTETIDIWGVQLEAGSIATPFQTATGNPQGELAACQRYYWRATAGSIYQAFASGHAVSTTGAAVFVANPVIMRATPTSLDYSILGVTNSAGSVLSLSSAAINYAGTQGSWIAIGVSSGLTAGNGTLLTAANSTSAYLGLNAEL